MTTKLMTVLVGVSAAWSVGARVICEAESPTTFVDSRRGVRYLAGTNLVQTLNWNPAWAGGDASAEAVITTDGGAELARGAGAGTYVWTNATYGAQTFTHTTYIGGIAQPEVYTATFCTIDVTGMGIPGLQRTTLMGKSYDAGPARMGVDPVVTCDGEGMYDTSIGQKTTYAYTGYMFFRAGETYTFRAFFDDFAWVTVDETCVVARNATACKEGTGNISFAEAGWRKVDFRVANNSAAGGLATGATYQGIWYKTDMDATWRPIADDGSGTLLRTGPDYCGVEILSARMRPSDPTILDIVYKVTSAKETVKVRALAYEDGKRSFETVVPVQTFADGTGANVGDAITANEAHTLSWQVAADWATDLSKVRFEVMVVEDEILPLHFVTIPATADHASVQYSDTEVSSAAVLNALLWLYASQDDDLTLTNGQLSNPYFVVADGATVKNEAQTVSWLYQKMGYGTLGGKNLEYVNATARINLSPSGIRQFAVKTPAP